MTGRSDSDGFPPEIRALLDRQATMGQTITAAHHLANFCENEFRAVVREALDQGASTRQIASLLGWNHSTVWRWACDGKSRRIESDVSVPAPSCNRNVLDEARRQPPDLGGEDRG